MEMEGRKQFYNAVDFIIDQLVNSCIVLFSSDFDHIKNAQVNK